MRIELEIWRQGRPRMRGFFKSHVVRGAEPQMSPLELLDHLNDQIAEDGSEPVVFESDCREGVRGACGFLVNGVSHGLLDTAPTYRQHLRTLPRATRFRLGPWRSAIFPVIRDLIVDRTAPDELIRAGGTMDVTAGTTPDADNAARGHLQAEWTLDFTTCIGYGAYVAACPDGAAALFAGAKLTHLSPIPQGRIERRHRARAMTRELDALFGLCSEFGECLPTCPAGIPIETIALLSREVLRADLRGATHGDQGSLHKQGRVRELVPQVVRSHP